MKKNNNKSDLVRGEEVWLYSERVKDHFFNPRNVMTEDLLNNYQADGIGEVGSPACGDMMRVWIKVDPVTRKITDCKWRTFGCASAIASTSALSEMAIGMTVDEAKKITPEDIIKQLGGLPQIKVHCSVLGDQALRAAIADWEKRKNH
ncbi:MAG: iron-sulfur cluster assembly scaffold protein [Patescibacteria group bacterium]|nr:iron-sulfur cluster assembly scaffold protein [Patescibacteria group bacterium]